MDEECISIFFKFISQEYINYLSKLTSTYTLQKRTNMQTDWKYIAQFKLSGYHQVPAENDYLLLRQERNPKKFLFDGYIIASW